MSKKIISFSLWGDNPMYNVGAIRNAESFRDAGFHDWTPRFYVGSDVPSKTIDELKGLSVEIVDMTGTPNDWQGMFWRFHGVNKEEDIDCIIFRDTDSRLTPREYEAVREWQHTDKCLHIMRDHPYHTEPIMGGMWGCKPSELIDIINKDIYEPVEGLAPVTNLQQVIHNWMSIELGRTERNDSNAMMTSQFVTKGIDQIFLRAIIYPLAWKNAHVQDAYPMYNAWSGRYDSFRIGGRKEFNTGFPSLRGKDYNNFIGQVYDEHDKPNEDYANLIKDRDELIYKDWGNG